MKEITEDTFVEVFNREVRQGRTVYQSALAFLSWLEREGYIKVKKK